MKKLFCLLLFFISFNAFCASPLWLGFGSTTRNYSTAQNDTSGGTKTFEFNPTLIVGTTVPLVSDFFFSPGIGYSKYSAQDNTTRNEIILQYHISQQIAPFFLLQYGLSNTMTKIGGKGGTVQLNNGNGTATFYVPSETKTSYMASLDFGGEFIFTNFLGARVQLSVDRFLSSDRRRVSHIMTINYYF